MCPIPSVIRFKGKHQIFFIEGWLLMAESMTQSEKQPDAAQIGSGDAQDGVSVLSSTTQIVTPVIWTPRFIATFALVAVIGLSVTSPLTEGWLNGYFPAGAIFLGYLALI